MKKVFIVIVSLFLLSSCGVGTYSLSSGKADKAEFKFASAMKGWLMFIGVMAIIGAVIFIIVGLAISAGGVLMCGISTLFSAIATICGNSWIKSNCLEK